MAFNINLLAEVKTDPTGALNEVKSTIDEVVKVVEELPGEDKTAARREKLRLVINPRFDFAEMAKRSLGAAWNDCTPEEQGEFVKIFSNLLAKTYLERIENIKPGMVKFDGEESHPPKSVVKTSVQHKGDTFPIDYRLYNKDGEWKVYDVIIENIGLVSNYRNEFAGIIRKEKFSGLMEKLRAKGSQG